MSAELVGIYIRPEMGDTENPVQMHEVLEAQVSETGIVGDRYESHNGFWQEKDNLKPVEKRKTRDVSILDIDDLEAANEQFSLDYQPIDTQRNLAVKGIRDIYSHIGETLQIGDSVQIYLSGDCNPCNRPEDISGKPNFRKIGKLAGVRGKVIKTGPIKKGDLISFKNGN